MSKEVKLAPEFGAFPVWAIQPGDNIHLPLDADNTMISAQLYKELEDWDKLYQDTLDQNYPPDSKFNSDDEELSYEWQGVKMWENLAKELGPEYTIIYHSPMLAKRYTDIEELKKGLSEIGPAPQYEVVQK